MRLGLRVWHFIVPLGLPDSHTHQLAHDRGRLLARDLSYKEKPLTN